VITNKNAMNEINSSKRLKFAVAERAEGDKILQVKAAEADAEAKYLSGVGVAKQRKAIVDGLRTSIVAFDDEVSGYVEVVGFFKLAAKSKSSSPFERLANFHYRAFLVSISAIALFVNFVLT